MIIAERMITEVINEKDLIPEDTESTETKEQETKNQAQETDVNKKSTDEVNEAEETNEKKGEDEKKEEDELAKKIEEALASANDKYLRLLAEYDNYRKRTVKEKAEIYTDATINCILEMLPVIDNFERALQTECSDDNYRVGIEMIFNQLKSILNKMNVKEIEALNKPFDPNLHNAIKRIDNEELEENTVCEVYQKGYMLGDKVIRYAMVAVAN
jgi:molecular chaperone GrpE